jgi:hypothetical protein
MNIQPEIVIVVLVTIGMASAFIYGYYVGHSDAVKELKGENK